MIAMPRTANEQGVKDAFPGPGNCENRSFAASDRCAGEATSNDALSETVRENDAHEMVVAEHEQAQGALFLFLCHYLKRHGRQRALR